MMPIRDGAALVNILRDSTERRRAKNRLQAATKATEPSGERYPLCGPRDDIASPFSVLVRPEMRRLRTLLHGRSSVANG